MSWTKKRKSDEKGGRVGGSWGIGLQEKPLETVVTRKSGWMGNRDLGGVKGGEGGYTGFWSLGSFILSSRAK